MSQIGIPHRPGTQASGRMSAGPVLPEIQHPLSRISNPENLDIRGASSRPGSVLSGAGLNSGRPLAAESIYPSRGGSRASGRIPSRLSLQKMGTLQERGNNIEAIPEGVEVIQGDPSKTRLPLFGSRADMASRAESRALSRLTTASAQTRLEIDEIEAFLKEKVKANFFEIRKRFKDNDPEGKGNVSKDGLFRIVVTVLGRPLGNNQFGRLLDRLRLADRNVINFTDFFAVFREAQSEEYPKWMDPIQRGNNSTDKATMTASQVHAHLKEQARQRVLNLADLISQSNPDGAGRILKPELRNALNKLGFYMENDEFEKLWTKYDVDAVGTVDGAKMMEKLGVNISMPITPTPKPPLMEPGSPPSGRPLKKKEAERQRSLNIERWLKNKFREGFSNMKNSFAAFDHDHSGFVSTNEFLEVLAQYGLRMEKPHMGDFLARCELQASSLGIPYQEFLVKFQDRSEGGMAHHILTNPKHRFNRPGSPSGKSTLSAVETELVNMFQKEFLSLLGTFHKIDKMATDRISQEEFRAAIESRFGLDMDDEQFRSLIDRVPLDDEGSVRYAEFMAQFDTKGRAPSLMGDDTRPKYKSIGPLPANPSPVPSHRPTPPLREPIPPSPIRMNDGTTIDIAAHRTTHELFKIIKDLLKSNYQAVESTFQELDEWNSKRLSQEMMFQLLKRFRISPEITRGEIRDLWNTFITNQDKSLDFQQFTRHFGFSLRSATFPNAKVHPPKRGDADFMIRSRKLNCAGDMLQDNLRAKIDYMWEDLRKEFHAMDPYKTGFVNKDEFREVLSELCVNLSEYELDLVCVKFNINSDDRISYLEFLKPYAAKKQVWRHGNNMLTLLQQPNPTIPMTEIAEPPQKGLHGITSKLRHQLSGDWKNLRRAFKKVDTQNEGYLSVPEFRSVLKLANIILDEDEVYHVLSRFDEGMTGKIPYNKFLSEAMTPHARPLPTRKSANL